MTVRLNPYLNFGGKAREAMEFYQSIFGGKLDVMTYGDMPEMPGSDPSQEVRVMHSSLATDDGLHLMGADAPTPTGEPSDGNMSVSLSGDDESTMRATGTSSPTVPRSLYRWRRRRGVTPSEC